MKKLLTFAILTSFLLYDIDSFANINHQTLTLINHFDTKLNMIVGINPQVLPNMPGFLDVNEEVKVTVMDIQKEAYVRAENSNKQYAFFGVAIDNNTVNVHGYMSKDVAFSWNKDTIVFCTKDEYQKHHGCV